MPLQIADLYLWYGRLHTEWFGELALFLSGGDPIMAPANLVGLREGKILAVE